MGFYKRNRSLFLIVLGTGLMAASVLWEYVRMKPDYRYIVEPWSIRGYETTQGWVIFAAVIVLRGSHLDFYGNVEGDDIFKGTTDVVVCDGFVGNVTLKASEGLAKMIATTLRTEFKRNWLTRIASLFALPVLNAFKRRLDPRRYNGATLLGLKGVLVKSHGSADRFAYEHAIETASDEVRNNVLKRITDQIQLLQRVAA